MGRVHSTNRPHSLSIPNGKSYHFVQSAYSWDFLLLCIYESCVRPNGSFRDWPYQFRLSLVWEVPWSGYWQCFILRCVATAKDWLPRCFIRIGIFTPFSFWSSSSLLLPR